MRDSRQRIVIAHTRLLIGDRRISPRKPSQQSADETRLLSLAPPRADHQRWCGARRGHEFARSDASRHAGGDTAAATRRSKRSLITGEGIVRTEEEAACRTGTRHRRLCRRLPRRRHRAAHYRAGVAGDALIAQPQLGASEAHRLRRGFFGQGQVGVERPPGRRHVATARRSDADRPRQSSNRARCRHLVQADARSRALP